MTIYFTYGRRLMDDGTFDHPTGLLPNGGTCNIFYNANYFGSANLSSLETLWMFDPTEISKSYFDEAVASQPVSSSL